MRKGSVWLVLVFAALLGAMAAKTLLEQPPQVREHSSPEQFDAVRAKARLATILGDQRAHPADSQADDLVRSRLVESLDRLGLKPIVREQFVCNELFKRRGVSCARVRNVVALLGPTTGKALLLNAHYDSVAAGPGASDDGIGVATLLEVGSILNRRPLERPVILLFNEGEELGLVGARAFLADPLSQNVASLVNLEARGVRGPVNMFETSRPNATPLKLFAEAVKNPVANSLATDIYPLMPNDTDVNSFAERGWLTFNLAPIGNETRYHSSGDDLAALDLATLQHMGDQTLALAQQLARPTPKIKDSNRIFMDVGGEVLISLPLVAGAVLLVALFVFFLAMSIRVRGLPAGIGTVIAAVIGSAILAWSALAVIGFIRGGAFWRAHPIWSHQASYASTILVGQALIATLAKDLSQRQLRSAFWLFVLTFGIFIGLVAPGGIIYFIFPPLLAALGMLISRWWRPAETLASAAAILLLFITWGALLGLFDELLDNGPMWAFAPFGCLLILPVLIEAKPLTLRVGIASATAISATLAILGWAAVAAAPAYSEDRQQRFVIQHVTDEVRGTSWWSVLNDGEQLPSGFPGKWKWSELPLSDRPGWITTAPREPGAKAPDIKLVSKGESGTERSVEVRLIANGNASVALIAPGDSKIRAAGMTGFVRPIDQNAMGKVSVSCSGRSCDGALVHLRIGGLKAVTFMIVGSRPRLPASAAPMLADRPKFARAQYSPDATVSFTRHTI